VHVSLHPLRAQFAWAQRRLHPTKGRTNSHRPTSSDDLGLSGELFVELEGMESGDRHIHFPRAEFGGSHRDGGRPRHPIEVEGARRGAGAPREEVSRPPKGAIYPTPNGLGRNSPTAQ